ncbi:alpha-galactosidase [Kribbella sp. VKM Ac-2569]|uniref:glycoside hydrolase family 36 protein n=1 Tax=Kribbella sp. VKM Ac-2569 TaxID=2512220 RepID=UPI00102B65BF|nr:glycoside hydrolase family 36 protein [Kribbella sp. VKM Ac-2569]RZT27604.1 alpha-galactosidase [Kribbella sp. VKM Ac-2569]
MSLLHWSTPDLALTFALDDGPVRLVAVRETTQPDGPLPDPSQPLVEISAIGYGHSRNRHANTVLGQRLRYVRHEDSENTLRIQQEDPESGLLVTSVFEARAGVRTWSEASMTGPGSLELTFLSSLVVGLESVDAELYSAANSWMAESRWSAQRLRAGELADIVSEGHHHVANTRHAVTSTNSWSCGERLPIGVLVDRGTPYALGWQIEHNGPWHYELGESRRGGYLLLSGPTDLEHQWTVELTGDKPFTSVPVSLVAGTDRDSVFAALTRQRRAIRQRRPIDDRMPVVFNDYMNTLLGDPTTEKLLPLIDAAAEAGADYFCIDAGWYAEGNWWDTVGAWQPSTTRFPNGLAEVIKRIHDRGMVPGLWLEPEVIGMRSPIAGELPDDAFLTRRGIRVAEGGRYLLDLRSPTARKHLDDTVDRLVEEFGVGFFKFDNNTITGPGTDKGGTSLGHGLLEHNRALLDWLDGLHTRHPDLLIENCGSGAMRMDYAMLSRLHLQSTSDQEDPLLYAPITAAAPAAVLPEQAGHWAYPITGTTREQFTFALVNGIPGRLYLSGHLNRMTPAELDLVRSALAAHRDILEDLDSLVPAWPLGLPGWTDDWIALSLNGPETTYLTLWHREPGPATISLPIPRATIVPHFPADDSDWTYTWADDDTLTVTAHTPEPSARVLRLTPTGQ